MKKILTLLVLASLLFSCDKIVKAATDSTSESLSDSDLKTITIDTLYQLKVPTYMKKMTTLHDEASFQYANIYKEVYTVVLHENKQTYIDVLSDYGEYDRDLPVIENYARTQKVLFGETVTDLQVKDYELTEINSHAAKQVNYTGEIDNIGVSYVISFIEGEHNIYMIMSWTLKRRFNTYKNTLEHINSSFKTI